MASCVGDVILIEDPIYLGHCPLLSVSDSDPSVDSDPIKKNKKSVDSTIWVWTIFEYGYDIYFYNIFTIFIFIIFLQQIVDFYRYLI